MYQFLPKSPISARKFEEKLEKLLEKLKKTGKDEKAATNCYVNGLVPVMNEDHNSFYKIYLLLKQRNLELYKLKL
jgi:hypothetical protein